MIYYCTIVKEGDMFIAQFPDMTNVVTGGFSHEEALVMAKEALDGCLAADISLGNSIPPPAYKDGYPIAVADAITADLQSRKLLDEPRYLVLTG